MKNTIGILGLGTRSTNYYIDQLHQKMHNHFGDYHTFPYINFQVNFNLLNPYLPNNFEQLKPNLQLILNNIKHLEINKWLIPNITLHETFDMMNHKLSLIHPVDLAIKYCIENNIKSVVIFGTNYTMESNYLASNFRKENISIEKTTKIDKDFINNFRIKIYNKKETNLDIENYTNLISKYSKKSNVVIACTELSLLTSKLKNKKILDLAQLQINETFNTYLNIK